MNLACCDCFCEAVSAHASIPGWCDGNIVLCPTLQSAEITAVGFAATVVLATCGINRWHHIHDPRNTVGPVHRYNASVTVQGRNVGRDRTGSWKGDYGRGRGWVEVRSKESRSNAATAFLYKKQTEHSRKSNKSLHSCIYCFNHLELCLPVMTCFVGLWELLQALSWATTVTLWVRPHCMLRTTQWCLSVSQMLTWPLLLTTEARKWGA